MLHINRFLVLSLAMGLCATASAQTAPPPASGQAPKADARVNVSRTGNVVAATSFPTSKLKGLNIRNTQGETIGSVDDLVINLTDGTVAYIAMSHGGVLGIGDKLFAVPFRELKFDHGKDEMHFVLDISKEKLDNAPGFDKSNWPDFANPQWRDQIDRYYHKSAADERTTRTQPARSVQQ